MSSRTSSATMSRTTTSKSSIGVSSSPCASPAAPSHRERGGAPAVAAAPTGDVQGLRDPSRPPRSVRRPGFGGRRLRGRRPGERKIVFDLPGLVLDPRIEQLLNAFPTRAAHQWLMGTLVGYSIPVEFTHVQTVAKDLMD